MQSNQIKNQQIQRVKKFINKNIEYIENSDQLIKKKQERDNQSDNKNVQTFFDFHCLSIKETVLEDGQEVKKFRQVKDTITLYNNRIRNLLLTRVDELPFDSDLGSKLYDFLFELDIDNNAQQQKNMVQIQINKYYPDVTINDINISRVENITDNFGYTKYTQGDVKIIITIDYTIPMVKKNVIFDISLNSNDRQSVVNQ